MGQFDIWPYFEEHPHKWVGSDDLQKIFNVGKSKRGNMTISMNKLRRFKLLYRKRVKERNGKITYNKNMYKKVPAGMTPILHDFQDDVLVKKQ